MNGYRGFLFENEADKAREFKIAEDYFNLPENKHEVKYSRKQSNLKHSYFKRSDGKIVAFSRGKLGGLIGAGAFGRVKFTMDKLDHFYVDKRELTNDFYQQQESNTARDQGLSETDKIERLGGEDGKTVKFHSSYTYVGQSLEARLKAGTLSFEQKLKIARKLCWAVHRLHTGQSSLTGEKIAHRDLKPANIAIDDTHDDKVVLIDFGLSNGISSQNTLLVGSPDYMPNSSNIAIFEQRVRALGAIGNDLYAIKRTLFLPTDNKTSSNCLFSPEEYNQLPVELKNIIDTTNVDNAVQMTKKNSVPQLTLNLFALEFQLDIEHINTLKPNHQEKICVCFALLEKLNLPIRDFAAAIILMPLDALEALNNNLANLEPNDTRTLILNQLKTQTEQIQIKLAEQDNFLHENTTQTEIRLFNSNIAILQDQSYTIIKNGEKQPDTAISVCIEKYKNDLKDAMKATHLGEIKSINQKLAQTIIKAKKDSPQMQAILEALSSLDQLAHSNNLFKSTRGSITKFKNIENALIKIPPDERSNFFNSTSTECQELRNALASHRTKKLTVIQDKQGNIDEPKAASSYKKMLSFKQRLQDIKQNNNDKPKNEIVLTTNKSTRSP